MIGPERKRRPGAEGGGVATPGRFVGAGQQGGRGARAQRPESQQSQEQRGGGRQGDAAERAPAGDRRRLPLQAAPHLEMQVRLEVQVSEVEALSLRVVAEQRGQSVGALARHLALDHRVREGTELFSRRHGAPPGASLRSAQSKRPARIRRSIL